MGFNSAFKGLKLLKKPPGKGRLNTLNDLVLNALNNTPKKKERRGCVRHVARSKTEDNRYTGWAKSRYTVIIYKLYIVYLLLAHLVVAETPLQSPTF